MSPAQRSLRASIAAHTQWSREENRTERTVAARKAAADRFDDMVDPQRKLAPEVRAKMAANARSAHFKAMAAASARARQAKRRGLQPRP